MISGLILFDAAPVSVLHILFAMYPVYLIVVAHLKKGSLLMSEEKEIKILNKDLRNLSEEELKEIYGGINEEDLHLMNFNSWMKVCDDLETVARSLALGGSVDQRFHFNQQLDELMTSPLSYWEQFHMTQDEIMAVKSRIAKIRAKHYEIP